MHIVTSRRLVRKPPWTDEQVDVQKPRSTTRSYYIRSSPRDAVGSGVLYIKAVVSLQWRSETLRFGIRQLNRVRIWRTCRNGCEHARVLRPQNNHNNESLDESDGHSDRRVKRDNKGGARGEGTKWMATAAIYHAWTFEHWLRYSTTSSAYRPRRHVVG